MFRAPLRDHARAVLAVGGFYAAFIAVGVVTGRAHDALIAPGAWWRRSARGLLGLSVPPLVAVMLVYAAIVGIWHRAPATWGLPDWRPAVRGLGRGVVWGMGLAAATVLMCLAGGARLVVQPVPDGAFASVTIPLAAGLAVAALLEELLFRGFPLARLAEAVGPGAAAVALAVVFAAAHLRNPDVSSVGFVNIGMASLLLSAAFLTPGGLATAFGLHFGWNAGLVFGADAPVSGLRFGLPGLEFVPGPRGWWTGGAFGPEGGLAATLVLGGALAWWIRSQRVVWGQRAREVDG